MDFCCAWKIGSEFVDTVGGSTTTNYQSGGTGDRDPETPGDLISVDRL